MSQRSVSCCGPSLMISTFQESSCGTTEMARSVGQLLMSSISSLMADSSSSRVFDGFFKLTFTARNGTTAFGYPRERMFLNSGRCAFGYPLQAPYSNGGRWSDESKALPGKCSNNRSLSGGASLRDSRCRAAAYAGCNHRPMGETARSTFRPGPARRGPWRPVH